MKLGIVVGNVEAHPATFTYLNHLYRSNARFSSIEEVNDEFRKNVPFHIPDLGEAFSNCPLIGHIPFSEFKMLSNPVVELIKKYNPEPWPSRLYVNNKAKLKINKLPYVIDSLPIVEEMPGPPFKTTKEVGKVVSFE